MSRQRHPQFVITSNKVIIRLLVALGLFSLFMNFLFLSPLEASETNPDFSQTVPHLLPPKPNETTKLPPPNEITKLPPPSRQRNPMELLSFPKLNEQEGKEHILSIFKEAGVVLDETLIAQLPTWSEVQAAVGDHPYILGLEKCADFREKVPAVERMLGSSGMFNTGTNLVTHLLKQNCQIPERLEKYGPKASREDWGMRWQVPVSYPLTLCYRSLHSYSFPQSITLKKSGGSTRLPSFGWHMRRQRLPKSTRNGSCQS
jgi:hypothetical protein